MATPTQEAAEPAEAPTGATRLLDRWPAVVGSALIFVSLALAAALALHQPGPPGAAQAASGFPAVVAARLYHAVGLAAWLACPLLVAWGWRVWTRTPPDRPARFVVAAPVAVVLAALALAALWPFAARPAGGVVGDVLYAAVVPTVSSLTGLGPRGVGIALAVLAGLAAIPALGAGRSLRRLAEGVLPQGIALPRIRIELERAAPEPAKPAEPVQRAAPAAPPAASPPREKSADKRGASARQELADLGPVRDIALPPIDLLAAPAETDPDAAADAEAMAARARQLESVLGNFGIKGTVVGTRPGPVVTLFEFEPAPGVKAAQVINLADDIARAMSAASARAALVPGRTVIGIEIPNPTREIVSLRQLLEADAFASAPGSLPLALGKDIGGRPVVADLASMPHLLIAGTTGSGKSVGISTIILSLLYRLPPDKCRFLMIDPKMLELAVFNGIPHLLAPVVTDPDEAVAALKWTVREMELRYKAMSVLGARNIAGYNQRANEMRERAEAEEADEADEAAPSPMPNIVVVVDEIADLMLTAGKDVETAVQRIAQMARAAGIHLVMATQRPSADVITGTIKANFPTRISFQVTSKIDSRTVLGESGAEQLLGRGDMLYAAAGGKIRRVHGAFVGEDEIESVASFLKDQGEPVYVELLTHGRVATTAAPADAYEDDGDDELYAEAAALVRGEGRATVAMVQRRLRISRARAAKLITRMEDEGIVGPANSAGRRKVLEADEKAIAV